MPYPEFVVGAGLAPCGDMPVAMKPAKPAAWTRPASAGESPHLKEGSGVLYGLPTLRCSPIFPAPALPNRAVLHHSPNEARVGNSGTSGSLIGSAAGATEFAGFTVPRIVTGAPTR